MWEGKKLTEASQLASGILKPDLKLPNASVHCVPLAVAIAKQAPVLNYLNTV